MFLAQGKSKDSDEYQLREERLEVGVRVASRLAHDFNNLLGTIILQCDILLDTDDMDPNIRSSVEQIKFTGERATNLTRKLMAFSRKQDLAPQAMDLNEVLLKMDGALRPLVGETVRLNMKLSPGLPRIQLDAKQFEQVVKNLVVNAVDSLPGVGSIEISTELKLVKETTAFPEKIPTGEYFVVSIKDTGCGMDSKVIERLFEPFFSTKSADKGKFLGLGLAMSWGIIKQCKGYISVESEPQKGSTFCVYLPKEEIKETEARLKKAQPTILLVEDQEELGDVMLQLLKKHGYNVLHPRTLDDSLEIIANRSQEVDLLLTDIVMPQSSGAELARRLIAKNPAVKVIFISGHMDATLSQFKLDEISRNFLQKPFSSHQLIRIIEQILGSK